MTLNNCYEYSNKYFIGTCAPRTSHTPDPRFTCINRRKYFKRIKALMLALCYIIINVSAYTYPGRVSKQQMWSSHHFEVSKRKQKASKKKKIVFITIPNRNELHSLHCINPKSGFPMLLWIHTLHIHTVCTLWTRYSNLFWRPFRLIFTYNMLFFSLRYTFYTSIFPLLLLLFLLLLLLLSFPLSVPLVFFSLSISLDRPLCLSISLDCCLFDHEHKLIWYSLSWKCA